MPTYALTDYNGLQVLTPDPVDPPGDGGLAINENFKAIADHMSADTMVHGLAGDVVGTTDIQTLTGKSISGTGNTLSDIPQSAVTSLSSDLATKVGGTGASSALAKFTGAGTVGVSRVSDSGTGAVTVSTGLQLSGDLSALAISGSTLTTTSSITSAGNASVSGTVSASTVSAATKIRSPLYTLDVPVTHSGTGTNAPTITIAAPDGGQSSTIGEAGGVGGSIYVLGGKGGDDGNFTGGSGGGDVVLRGGLGGGAFNTENDPTGTLGVDGSVLIRYPDESLAMKVTQGMGQLLHPVYGVSVDFWQQALVWAGTASVDWGSRTLINSSAAVTLDWQGRTARDATSTVAFNWNNAFSLPERNSTPSVPPAGTEARVYVKGDKLIVQFNDGGTARYKCLDLTGTSVTWTHSTTAP